MVDADVQSTKKITLYVPDGLLRRAQEVTGGGITSTIRQALELLAAAQVYDQVLNLRGSVRLDIDVDTLREDRSFVP